MTRRMMTLKFRFTSKKFLHEHLEKLGLNDWEGESWSDVIFLKHKDLNFVVGAFADGTISFGEANEYGYINLPITSKTMISILQAIKQLQDDAFKEECG